MSHNKLERHGETGSRPAPYLQIAQALAEQISAGDYPPESRLPSGAQLCQRFGVSSMTLRRALAVLEDKGLVHGVKGSGTFVKSPDFGDPDFRLDPVVDDGWHEPADTRLLSTTMTRADARGAKILGVPVGTRLVHFRRLVYKNETPAMYHNEYILYDPTRALVESQLQLTALESLMESDRAERSYSGELVISALLLDAASADVLGGREGAPALSLEHVFFDSENRPVSYGSFLLRADLFRLRSHSETARKVIGVEIRGDS
jgi:DNA-binding GntR family transcriptional regulator